MGVVRLKRLLGSPEHRAVLAETYRIDHLRFHRLSGEAAAFSGAARAAQAAERLASLEEALAESRAQIEILEQSTALSLEERNEQIADLEAANARLGNELNALRGAPSHQAEPICTSRRAGSWPVAARLRMARRLLQRRRN